MAVERRVGGDVAFSMHKQRLKPGDRESRKENVSKGGAVRGQALSC